MQDMNLRDFLLAGGRGSIGALAKTIGAHSPDVSRWASGGRPVPEKAAVAIERASGGLVTRKELRPDDWQDIWPELAEPVDTCAVQAEGQGVTHA